MAALQFLNDHGANIQTNSLYALNSCAKLGDMEAVKYLIKLGAADFDGSALCCAVEEGHLVIVKYLVELGPKLAQFMMTLF